MEAIVIGVIILGILFYNGTISKDKFIKDNEKYFDNLKEDDYDFLVYAKFGENVEPNVYYKNRIRDALIAGIFALVFIVLGSQSTKIVINLVLTGIIVYFVFKSQYMNLKSSYKKHLHQIDIMLPYYLKSLEILIQHYTVPVAIAKSIEDAPDIFKPGLRVLIEKVNAGDSTIDPYMEFANTYPVRDSMRMMRLLYRLGIGSQERKQERLMMFSRTVSNLQNKARETKYKERLNYMENQTMIMLVVTGIGVMAIILVSMLMMFNI